MKDSGLRIRVERQLHEKFLSICCKKDRPAAQVVREFMRVYVAEHTEASEDVKNNDRMISKEKHEH